MEEEKTKTPEETEQKKSLFRQKKEEWYDRLNVTVKQMDRFIIGCFIVLGLVFILIALEAAGIFTLFPGK